MTQGDIPFDGDPPEGSSSRCDGSSHVQCARPGCDRTFDLAGRQAEHRRYCGRDCQRRAWEETHPRLESGRDALQRLPSKLTRAQKILLRLRQGPATGLELLHAGGGIRYGARILELRQAGHAIETDMGGEWPTYTLISERL